MVQFVQNLQKIGELQLRISKLLEELRLSETRVKPSTLAEMEAEIAAEDARRKRLLLETENLRQRRRDLRSDQAGKIGFSIFLACLFSGPLAIGVVSNTRKNLEAQSAEIRTLRDKLAQVTAAQQDQKEEIAREVGAIASAQNSRSLENSTADQIREAVAEITWMQGRLEKVEQQLQEQKLSGEALAQSQTRIRLEIYQLRRAMIALMDLIDRTKLTPEQTKALEGVRSALNSVDENEK
jgi:hypothetical protein